jgi:hypothetical protein
MQQRRRLPWPLVRLAVVVAAANALLLLAASGALAQASSTSTTLPPSEAIPRRVNLPFVIVAIGGAVLILVMQRRASRKVGDLFPSDPEPDDRRDGQGDRSDG